MKIFIFGNTGSGKTTIANELIKIIPFELVSIDNFRIIYGDFTWKGETEAVDRFIKKINIEKKNQIIECSGLGKSSERIKSLLSKIDDKILIVALNCSSAVCHERTKNKMWYELKMPKTNIEVIQNRIQEFDAEQIIKENYSTRYKTLVIDSTSDRSISENINLIYSYTQ